MSRRENEQHRDCLQWVKKKDFLMMLMKYTDIWIMLQERLCMVIARLVMALIISILSIDSVKYRIKPDTLNTMHSVYDMAHKVAQSVV